MKNLLNINKKENILQLAFFAIIMIASFKGFAQKAYITNSGDNTVSVIDLASNTVTATINVGSYPSGVSVSPDASKVYITNTLDNTVSVINTATDEVTSTIKVGNQPDGLAFSEDGSKLYVANGAGGDQTVSVINTASNTVIASIPIGGSPVGIAVWPNDDVWVTNNYPDGSVSVFSPMTGAVKTTNFHNSDLEGIAISPDASKVFIARLDDSTVYSINSNTGGYAKILLNSKPYAIAFSPNSTTAYVTGFEGEVSVIDVASDEVKATIRVGFGASGVSVSPDGSKVLVACRGWNGSGDSVFVINTATNQVSNVIKVGSSPTAFGNFIANINASTPSAIENSNLSNNSNENGKKVCIRDYCVTLPSVMQYDSSYEKDKDTNGNWPYGYEVNWDNKNMTYTSTDPFAGEHPFGMELDTFHYTGSLETKVNEWEKWSEKDEKKGNLTIIKPREITTKNGIKGYVVYNNISNEYIAEITANFIFPLKVPNVYGRVFFRFLKDGTITEPQKWKLLSKSLDEVFQSVTLNSSNDGH